jgi:hypothetical protein
MATAQPAAEFAAVIRDILALKGIDQAAVVAYLKANGGLNIDNARKWKAQIEAELAPKPSTALVEAPANAQIVVSSKPERNAVEYDTIQDFVDTVIVGVMVTVQACQTNNWTVEIDGRLGPDGKLARKPRSQPSIYGAKESTLPNAKPGDTYTPTQHLLPIRVTDPITNEVTDKWLDTNAGFRKAMKEQIAMGTMPPRFTLKSQGVNDTYRCFIIPSK